MKETFKHMFIGAMLLVTAVWIYFAWPAWGKPVLDFLMEPIRVREGVTMENEMMEITVVVYEDALRKMLKELEEAKEKGDASVMIEQGAVTFHVCSSLMVEVGE